MEIAFHQRMRDGFRDIAAAEPQRVALIDAEAKADRVGEAIVGLVRERLGISL
jgi:dTMP kinase